MRLLLASLIACGPPHVFHKDAERGCGDAVVNGREDVAAYAGCATLASLTIRTGAPLDLAPLARLERVDGDVVVGPSVGLAELALPRLAEVRGTLRVVANGDLHAVILKKLARAGRIEIDTSNALASLVLPSLTAVGAISITSNPELEVIDFTALATVPELVIAGNPKLVTIEGTPDAKTARIENNKLLPEEVADRMRGAPKE
jgi:hypothetical protein